MTANPFGSASDDSLVSETAIDTGQTELIMTPEQFDDLDNKVVRRLAAELDTDEVHGKMPRFVTRSAIAVQRSLDEYSEE
jgi:hypothetical protein